MNDLKLQTKLPKLIVDRNYKLTSGRFESHLAPRGSLPDLGVPEICLQAVIPNLSDKAILNTGMPSL